MKVPRGFATETFRDDLEAGVRCPEWLVGERRLDPSPKTPPKRWIVHLRAPSFVARVVLLDADRMVDPCDADADLQTGPTAEGPFDDGSVVLCEVQWGDDPPPAEEVQTLLRRALVYVQREPEEDE